MTKPNYWDEAAAKRYDTPGRGMFAPEVLDPTVEFLVELADGRPVLEFAIGTGRVALPLSARGVEVHGLEYSEAMVAQLRTYPGSKAIPVTIGDMAHTRVDGQFGLVYLVFNTIMNLTTQDDQVACFENAAAHLEPGGRFVIEVIVPMLRRVARGMNSHVFAMGPDHIGIEEFTDEAEQIAYSHHWIRNGDRVTVRSAPFRYVWPSELDLMARIAGLTLVERWADWNRTPFTSGCESHVSVWQK